MKVLIFGGTTEGRLLARRLREQGAETSVSVATELGAQELTGIPDLKILIGRKTVGEMADLLSQFDRCVDATHPYAVEASGNIRAACELAGVPLRRLLRRESGVLDGLRMSSTAEAREFLMNRPGNIMLTTGAKELAAFAALGPERLFPRVLPVEESIRTCRALGIPVRNIVAMHGPFSQRLNEAIMEQFQIRWMVTKDGGSAGGFAEKAEAARAMGVEMIVIDRPQECGEDLEEILTWLAN